MQRPSTGYGSLKKTMTVFGIHPGEFFESRWVVKINLQIDCLPYSSAPEAVLLFYLGKRTDEASSHS